MDTDTKRGYMRTVQKRYLKASKKQKSKILTEITENLEIHRKSAIRLVNSDLAKKTRTTYNKTFTYGKKVLWIIEELWKLTEYPCGTILKATIPTWLPTLKKHFPIDPLTEGDLRTISPSTIDRRLAHKKKYLKNKIYGTTKPGKILRSQIPIRTSSSGITKPGSLELDTVAHCGFCNSGEFIYTVNAVDIASTWISRRAVLGKGMFSVQKAIDAMRTELPFPLLDIDFDNGDEFLNWHLIDYCTKHSIACTRSRPYKKDDQAHIEQKNSTHVRRIFGRIRLDKAEVLILMNDLYTNELMLYHNFFKPSQKLIKKTFIASRMIRKFDTPRTPYERLLESPYLSKKKKHQLTRFFNSLNPINLKKAIDEKIKRIFYIQSHNQKEAQAS